MAPKQLLAIEIEAENRFLLKQIKWLEHQNIKLLELATKRTVVLELNLIEKETSDSAKNKSKKERKV